MQLPVEIRRIVQIIRQTIAARRDLSSAKNDRVHLIVNETQYNEFSVIKNIENIIRLTVYKRLNVN